MQVQDLQIGEKQARALDGRRDLRQSRGVSSGETNTCAGMDAVFQVLRSERLMRATTSSQARFSSCGYSSCRQATRRSARGEKLQRR
jgi:hypothetical protein